MTVVSSIESKKKTSMKPGPRNPRHKVDVSKVSVNVKKKSSKETPEGPPKQRRKEIEKKRKAKVVKAKKKSFMS